MKKIGITGGIGSGKTTICHLFELLGIPVYYADDRAKFLMTQHPPLVKQIIDTFGGQAYLPSGELNRTYLAELVFSDATQLQKLNRLVHPYVFEDAERWHKNQVDVPYTLKEAALLFESGSFRTLHRVITVYAPRAMRIQRVMQRDLVSKEKVIERVQKQMPDDQKIALADYVITNNGAASLIPQVLSIHKSLIA